VVRRFVAIAAPVLVVAIVTANELSGGSSGHPLRAEFSAALQLRPGNDVEIGGRVVGSVAKVSLNGGLALVQMDIADASWPVRSGTTAALRYGSAVAYASRNVELHPGPAGNPPLADNALLPLPDTTTPVEFDQVYATFGPATRQHFGSFIQNAARTLHGHAADLTRTFSLGGRGIARTADFFGDLNVDPAALDTLVRAGAATTAALRATDPNLRALVTNAAQTFTVFADDAAAVQSSLVRLPTTLRSGRLMLARLDRSLPGVRGLLRDIAPGAAGLRRDAPLLSGTLTTLTRIAPIAERALTTGTRSLPAVTGLLRAATPFLPNLSDDLAKLAPMVGCLRPYAPEIGGYLVTWQSGPVDSAGHFARIDVIQTPIPPGTTMDSAQAIAGSQGSLHYAMPRPPGLNAGTPWFQPQCGAGPSALDPTKDPEAGRP
jgi:virulence factor Mce-like protein